jgi:hypothetical protein
MPSYCVNQILFVLGGFSSGSLQKNPMAEREFFVCPKDVGSHADLETKSVPRFCLLSPKTNKKPFYKICNGDLC